MHVVKYKQKCSSKYASSINFEFTQSSTLPVARHCDNNMVMKRTWLQVTVFSKSGGGYFSDN